MSQKHLVPGERGLSRAHHAAHVLQSAPVEQFALVVTGWHRPHHRYGETGWIEFWADPRLVNALAQFGLVHNINSSPVGDQQYRLDVSLMLNFDQVRAVIQRLSAGTPDARARFARTGRLPTAALNWTHIALIILGVTLFCLMLFGTIAALVT